MMGPLKMMRRLMAKSGKNLAIALCLIMASIGANAQIYVGGPLAENTTWVKNGQYYIVVENVIVPKGITLTIEPGVTVLFELNTSLLVKGTLFAQGTQADSILFLPEGGQWNGIQFQSSVTEFDDEWNYTGGTILSYARIENSAYSIVLQDNAGVLVENCKLKKASFGFYIKDATANVIRNCVISDNDFGVFLASSFTIQFNWFLNNRITDNLYVGFFVNNSNGLISHNTISGNRVSKNLVGLYLGNDGPVDQGFNLVSRNIFDQNSFGIRLFQDTSIIERNYIINNTITGIEIIGASRSTVRHNLIAGNNFWGLAVEQGASGNYINHNSIEHNQNGVLFTPGKGSPSLDNSFNANGIHHNNDTAFCFRSVPQQNFYKNSIYRNKDTAAFANQTDLIVNAPGNWWGTADTNAINAFIFDVFDDPSKGMVDYKAILSQPDTAAPITAPVFALKRSENNGVIISWPQNPESDLAGYRVHYGTFDGFGYQSSLDVGNDTAVFLENISLNEPIVVTAYDLLADGLLDRPEGYESDFTLAIPGPWAGNNTEICYNSKVFLGEASANSDYKSLFWTSSGDGIFDDSAILHPYYTPGTIDQKNGLFNLVLHVVGEGYMLNDELRVRIMPRPYVYAGSDTTVIGGAPVLLSGASADFYKEIHWITLGDGTFDDAGVPVTNYHTGVSDIESGEVKLILYATSECGTSSDTMMIRIIAGYSISGRVHAGNTLAAGSVLNLYRVANNIFSSFRSSVATDDGSFTFPLLTQGEYYIYAIPGEDLKDSYSPVYYYNDLLWENAHKLTTTANTYDVDIDLYKLSYSLPLGVGAIKGNCECSGQSVSLCTDVTILLYDKTMTYLLGWLRPDNYGEFEFSNLPYGEYVLIGEKAGYRKSETPIISLSADHPFSSGVTVNILPYKISIAIPPVNDTPETGITISPNPTDGMVYINGLSPNESYQIVLLDAVFHNQGFIPFTCDKVSGTIELTLNSLPAGLYVILIKNRHGILREHKIIKYASAAK